MRKDVTTHEAIPLAASCKVIERASSLGRWVKQSGPRAVTAGRVLRKSDVPDAAAVIGVQVPAKFRTAAYVPDIQRPWELALALDLLRIDGGTVSAGPRLDAWPPEEPEEPDGETILDAWFDSLIAPDSDERRSITEADLLAVLKTTIEGLSPTDPGFTQAAIEELETLVNEFDAFSSIWGQTELDEAVARLELYGAIDESGITPIGVWAEGRLGMRVTGPGPEMSPADLIAYLGTVPDDDLYRQAWSWFDKQPDTLRAARDVLTAGAVMEPRLRWTAANIVGQLGLAALPVWRQMRSNPDIGPRAAYAIWELQGKPKLTDGQWLWLAVESSARALAVDGPDEATSVLWGMLPADKLPVDDLEHRLAIVRATDHPGAQALADAIEGYVAESGTGSLAVNQVLQLKITLKVLNPPIWRTVLVPASTFLDELHEVIQVLFGWDGDHLHMFRAGEKRYTDPSFDLNKTIDEASTRVEPLLAKGKLSYEYDLAEGWRHEITLQKKLPRSSDAVYPVCVKFSGDSPVEYPEYDDDGEYIEQVPELFDLAAVNEELAELDS